MGSAIALREALKLMGKNADVYVNSNFPHYFKFYGSLDDVNKKSDKILININNIVRVNSVNETYYKSGIVMVTNMGYLVVETY